MLEELLRRYGYQPVVRVGPLSEEEVWDWATDGDFVGVVTWHEQWPVSGKRGELQELVDCFAKGLPVLAVAWGESTDIGWFDSECHFTIASDSSALRKLVSEHLAGTCALCAQYRS